MTQLTDAEIVTRIRSVLSRVLGDEIVRIEPDAELAQALGERYDSLTAMECIAAVEAEFDIEVDFVAHDVRHWFATVARMARFVRNQLEDRALLGSNG
jgi:acyl carrier protein